MTGAKLMVESVDGVPHPRFGEGRIIQLRPRGNLDGPAFVQLNPLDVGEEVQLVLDQRTAEREPELLFRRIRLVQVVLCLEEIFRAETLVREVLERAAVKLIGARLDDRVDDGPGGAAELGVELTGQDLELLRRLERHARLRAVVLAEVIVVVPGAIHQVAVVARVDAVGGQRVGTPRGKISCRHHARQQAGEIGEVAGNRRDVRELPGGDVAADLLRGDVDDGRFAAHRHGFLQRADLERHVDRQLVAYGEREVAADEFLESRELRRDLIPAGRKCGHEPRAVRSADDIAEVARLLIGDGDGHTRESGLLLVDHPTPYLGGALLCERVGRGETQRQANQRTAMEVSTHVGPRKVAQTRTRA